MSSEEIQQLYHHITAAAAILEKLRENCPERLPLYRRDPAHFRETGHLSDAGIEAIYKLFDQGRSIEQAAKDMGISIRGAASRRQAWAKRLKAGRE